VVKILMTGGTGFIGSYLAARLSKDGHEVTILIRSSEETKGAASAVSFLQGDPTRRGPWQEAIRNHDAAINLAGAPIFTKWTDEQKRVIRESRVSTTRNLVEGIAANPGTSFALFSSSGTGYYGYHGDEELTEASSPGIDFLATVARDWEAEALKAQEKGARVVLTRFGIVLGARLCDPRHPGRVALFSRMRAS
jgi:uncharacterized protein (TIGR01777 family)